MGDKKDKEYTLTETDIAKLWQLAKKAPYGGKDHVSAKLLEMGFHVKKVGAGGYRNVYKVEIPDFIREKGDE